MPNVNPKQYDTPFSMRVDRAFLTTVDKLRRKRDPIPTRADIIREAVAAYGAKVK